MRNGIWKRFVLKLFSPRFSFGEQSIHDLQIVWVITNVLLRGRTLDLLSQILCLSVLRAKIRRAHENHCAFHAGEEVQPDGLGVAAQRSAACRRIMISDGGANETKMRL